MPNEDVTKPNYYQFEIEGVAFDVFDLVRAIQAKRSFSFEEATALKYLLRIKYDSTDKRVEDLEKAMQCLSREADYLRKGVGKESVVRLEGVADDNGNVVFNFQETIYGVHICKNGSFILFVSRQNKPIQYIDVYLLESLSEEKAHRLPAFSDALVFLHTYFRQCIPHITFSITIDEGISKRLCEKIVSQDSEIDTNDFIEIQPQKRESNSHTYLFWFFRGIYYEVEIHSSCSRQWYVVSKKGEDPLKKYLDEYDIDNDTQFSFGHKIKDAVYFENMEQAKRILQAYLSHIAGKQVRLL